MRSTKQTDPASPSPPSTHSSAGELNREKYRSRYKKLLRSTVGTLVNVAAISVLVATLLLPVFSCRYHGTSMNPNLHEGEIDGIGEIPPLVQDR